MPHACSWPPLCLHPSRPCLNYRPPLSPPQRTCREQLREQQGLSSEQREFMLAWNLFLHRHPLHADADLPAALARFAAQPEHVSQLAADGPFRRCLVSHLLTLWRFRLLAPQQLHGLLAALPRLAAA